MSNAEGKRSKTDSSCCGAGVGQTCQTLVRESTSKRRAGVPAGAGAHNHLGNARNEV